MSSEYIRLEYPEKLYGKTNLLHTQLETLLCVKHLREYLNLRKEDLVLRIALKKKIEEVQEFLNIIDKTLPKAHFVPNKEEKEILKMFGKEDEKKNITLEQELEEIREKLKRLQK